MKRGRKQEHSSEQASESCSGGAFVLVEGLGNKQCYVTRSDFTFSRGLCCVDQKLWWSGVGEVRMETRK